MALREAKCVDAKDRLNPPQHKLADRHGRREDELSRYNERRNFNEIAGRDDLAIPINAPIKNFGTEPQRGCVCAGLAGCKPVGVV